MRTEIYTAYAESHDLTFVMEETFDDEDNSVTLEVKGFYFGEPDDSATKTFYNDLKAEFTD